LTVQRFGIHLPTAASSKFERTKDLAVSAEKLGYDSVWVADHLLGDSKRAGGPRGSGIYEPLITLGALTSVTSRVKLGTAVLLPLRHPVVTASMISTLDHASGGRIILGLGVGWNRLEFDAMNIPFESRGKLVDESIATLIDLWTKPNVRLNGEYFKMNGVVMNPKPVQEPHPGIWVGGNGRAAIRRALQNGVAWIPTDYTTQEYKDGLKTLSHERKGIGKHQKNIIVASHLFMCIDTDSGRARRKAEFLKGMTGENIRSIEKWAIIGTPAEVLDRITEYSKVGVSYHIFSFPAGTEEEDYALLRDEVISKIS